MWESSYVLREGEPPEGIPITKAQEYVSFIDDNCPDIWNDDVKLINMVNFLNGDSDLGDHTLFMKFYDNFFNKFKKPSLGALYKASPRRFPIEKSKLIEQLREVFSVEIDDQTHIPALSQTYHFSTDIPNSNSLISHITNYLELSERELCKVLNCQYFEEYNFLYIGLMINRTLLFFLW